MESFEAYQHRYEYITIAHALGIIRELDCCREKVLVLSRDRVSRHLYGKLACMRIDSFCDSLPQDAICSKIKPVTFCGGPPNTFFWTTGRLVDFIVDKMMYRDAKNNQFGMLFAHKVLS